MVGIEPTKKVARLLPYRSATSTYLVPMVGVEPTRPCGHWILSPARLPIPPHRHKMLEDYEPSARQKSNFIFQRLRGMLRHVPPD